MPLTAAGEEQARLLREPLACEEFARVFCSSLARARETCELAGLGDRAELRDELLEWDYGEYEGITSAKIREQRPGWLLWRDGCPGGESTEDVGRRADRIIEQLLGVDGAVAVFAHGHLLRILAARWSGLEPVGGQRLALDTGTLSRLGWEHDYRVIRAWNAPV